MTAQDTRPEMSRSSSIPPGDATCLLSAIDTTCNLTVPADTLVEPLIPGHELMNFPTIAFLITHESSNRQLLFDLGCRKDFWNSPAPIANVINSTVPGIKVDKSLVDILSHGGVNVAQLEAAIISHHHYDHIGDPSTFPKSMDLIVGPGFSDNFLPGYPTVKTSPVFTEAFENRKVRQVNFTSNLVVAGYRAHDYFGDGSLYILDTPGHAIGHLSALVRTTHETFVFLGGDICHFGGSFRPTPLVPMPETLSLDEIGPCEHHAMPVNTDIFTRCHPDPENCATMPFYRVCSRRDSWYVDPRLAGQSIARLETLDADDRVLVLIAHDPSVVEEAPFFPRASLNDWHATGLKYRLRWRFLKELPVHGGRQKYLVSGTYIDGKLVKPLLSEEITR